MGKALYALADQGQYFTATNTTPGTGIDGIAAADGNSDLENYFHLLNSDTASGGKRIYLDYLIMRPTAAGTNGTTTEWVSKIDTTTRYTSGGSAITPVNPNADSSNATIATLRAGALVTTAASAQKIVGHGMLRSVIKVIGDMYIYDFGAESLPHFSNLSTVGTAIAQIHVPHPPVILGPGHAWMFQINGASQSVAASYEFQLGWWEM